MNEIIESVQKHTVLVVDDKPLNIDLLEGLLHRDYQIKSAVIGEDALQIAGSDHPPDIILLDIEMPGMDGYEVCRRLKSNPLTRDIPVVFVTGRSDPSDEVRGLELGAVDYIRKPFTGPIIRERIKTQITLKLMRQKIMETFGRHVDPAVAGLVLSGGIRPEGEMINVTLLFSDIRNFATFAERNQPPTVFQRINKYYSIMSEVIKAYDGVVLQYVGDEIEAAFGAPLHDEHHADKAVQAALEMRSRLKELNSHFAEIGQDLLQHGIGIHSGPVMAGMVGSTERQNYCLVGDTVNVASRIADLCKFYSSDILVSHQTRLHLTKDYEMEELPPARIKGRHKSLTVFKM